MYIYQWQAGYSAAKGDPLVVTQNTSCKTDDNGLDKIKSKQDLINKYSNCIQIAQETIPNDRKNRTYLFLAATAGMRLLEYNYYMKLFTQINAIICLFIYFN
jgi:Golgi nucleoside diphosphatase